jgi:hypothetical protein
VAEEASSASALATRHEPLAPSTSLSPQAGASLRFARLLVKLADPNFLLDAAAFHQFAEATNRLLSRFSFAKRKLNHVFS